MAHQVEIMEVDDFENSFDNKENSLQHHNLLTKPPCTEKGYEELDVSELNMKLRYSVTPAASPMSKSYTTSSLDNRPPETDFSNNTVVHENENLTRSLDSTVVKNDLTKAPKSLPLQSLPTAKFIDSSLRTLDNKIESQNITVIVSGVEDLDENLSYPSTSSSVNHTPEATTPTKDIHVQDGGSPIMRGLKSVLNMFRSSQSPIPLAEGEKEQVQENDTAPESPESTQQASASTPLNLKNKNVILSKRSSSQKDSLVFNDDLEKELEWKDETTILFSDEKIPIHKLFFQNVKPQISPEHEPYNVVVKEADNSVEYMDISYDSISNNTANYLQNDTLSSIIVTVESDGEFVDCETTITKYESLLLNDTNKQEVDDTEMKLVKEIQTIPIEQITNLDSESTVKPLPIQEANVIQQSAKKETITENISEPNGNTNGSVVENVFDDLKDIIQQNNKGETITKNISEPHGNTNVSVVDNVIDDLKEIIEPSSQVDTETEKNFDLQSLKDVIIDEENVFNNVQETINNQIIENKIDDSIKKVIENDDKNNENNCNENAKELCSNNECLFECESKIEDKTIEIINEQIYDKDINIKNESSVLCDESKRDVVNAKSIEHIKKDVIASDLDTKHSEIINYDLDINIKDDNLQSNDNFKINLDSKIELTNLDLQVSDFRKNNTIMMNEIDFNKSIFYNQETLPKKQCNSDVTDKTTEDTLALTYVADNVVENISVPSLAEKSIDDQNIEGVNNLVTEHEPGKENAVAYQEIEEQNESFQTDSTPGIENFKGECDVSVTNLNNDNLENCSTKENLDIHSSEIEPCLASIKQGTCIEADLLASAAGPIKLVQKNTELHASTDTIEIKTMNDSGIKPATENKINFNNEVEKKQEIDESNELIANAKPTVPKMNEDMGDEELVASENNSPFISLSTDSKSSADEIKDERVDDIPMDKTTMNTSFVLLSSDSKTNNDEIKDEQIDNDDINIAPVPTYNISPPGSPKIISKGYNLNFDEMDDPFATKMKIRMSPPPAMSPNTSYKSNNLNKTTSGYEKPKKFDKNRRYQPAKIKTSNFNKIEIKQNKSTKNDTINVENVINNTSLQFVEPDKTVEINTKHDVVEDGCDVAENSVSLVPDVVPQIENKTDLLKDSALDEDLKRQPLETESIIAIKSTSSSDQSTYYVSIDTSSNETIESKSVFNLPEIDDKFIISSASKTSNVLSEPVWAENNLNVIQSDKNPNEFIEITSSETELKNDSKTDTSNTSNTTCSSKVTDEKDVTVRELHTDTEDTVEGPFFNDDDDFTDTEKIDSAPKTSEWPVQQNYENADGDEVFIDAETFEFLMNQNQTNEVVDSGKESLFLKFDPLFARRLSSDGVVAALKQIKNRQSTPKKATKVQQKNVLPEPLIPTPGPSQQNITFEANTGDQNSDVVDDFNSTNTKPTMVVTPAINPVVTPRNKAVTPPNSNRRSINFTSPAMAVIDRLISLSNNNSPVPNTTVTNNTSQEQYEADSALIQLRELLSEKEQNVQDLRSETVHLKNSLSTLKAGMKSLEVESEERLRKVNELNDRLLEKTKINKSMAHVVEEYERTIASLISEKEQEKKRHAEERMVLIKERDEQTAHLASMEVSFSDLHSKYEKSKQVILGYKTNEEIYLKSINDFEENVAKMQNNYELLKQHATSKLNHANQELEKINKSHESEVLKLNAMIKRKELHINSLEETLAQKTKANEELTAICDELINKVG